MSGFDAAAGKGKIFFWGSNEVGSWVSVAGAFCGYSSGGFLADRIGRRLTFLTFAVGVGAVVVIYTFMPFGNRAMLALGFPLGFFASGVFSAMGPFFTEHFPTRVRGVGQGFAYNVGRASGALFPTLVGLLSARMPLGEAIGMFAGLAYATMAVAAFLLPENARQDIGSLRAPHDTHFALLGCCAERLPQQRLHA